MAKKASATDAQLLMQLYDLRREAEMRRARQWWLSEFWPDSADDFLNVAMTPGTKENNWMRQVASYWGMAASFVLQGALSEELFLRPASSGEMFIMFGKLCPFLGELRDRLGDPEAFRDVETVITRSKWGRERLKFMRKRLEEWRAKMAVKA